MTGTLRSLVVAAALLAALQARADATYSASVTGALGVQNSPTPVVLTGGDANAGGTAVADDPLGAAVHTAAPARGFNTGLFTEASADVAAFFDDIVVSGPGTDPIPVALHLPFDALFSQQWSFLDFTDGSSDVSSESQGADFFASLAPFFEGTAEARILVNVDQAVGAPMVSLNTQNGGSVHSGGAANPLDAGGFLDLTAHTATPIGTGPGVEPVGAGFLVQDSIGLGGEIVLAGTVPHDVPMTLSLHLSIDARAFGGFGLDAFGSFDALHTFGLRQGGAAVFDLPEGYTVSSPSLHIVDNVVVPEPAEEASLACGLLGALACRRVARDKRPRSLRACRVAGLRRESSGSM
jgi:hypothetical protein